MVVAAVINRINTLQCAISACAIVLHIGNHSIDIAVGFVQPIVHLIDKGSLFVCRKCPLGAAVGDAAAVGACNAAHKAKPCRNDAAAVCCGSNIAAFHRAFILPGNAAHVAGTAQLLLGGLAVAQCRCALHLQRDAGNRAPGNLAAVQADNAADRIAGVRCAIYNVAGIVCIGRAQHALIGTLIQSAAVAANNAAQIHIFNQIVRHVQRDICSIDFSAIGTNRAAKVDYVRVGSQAVQIQRAIPNRNILHITAVVACDAAHVGCLAVELNFAGQRHIFNCSAAVVDGRHRTDALARGIDFTFRNAAAGNSTVIDGGKA